MNADRGDRRGTMTRQTAATRARTCYMVINHRPIGQAERLLRVLRRQQPEASLVLHHDASRAPIDAARVERQTGAHVIEAPRPVEWGSFEVALAHWRMLEWAMANTDSDWFVLLSGQDYPVQPLSALERKLAETTANAFMFALPFSTADPVERRDLYLRYWYRYPWRAGTQMLGRVPAPLRPAARRLRDTAASRLAAREGRLYFYYLPDGMGHLLGWRRRWVPFDNDKLQCWKGSNWITMDRKAAEALMRYCRDNPDFVDHYRHCALSAESVTQTVLMNDPSLQVELEWLHCQRWDDPPGPHPYLLTSADYDYLVSSGKPFGRKFDPAVDSEILDRLDDMLAGSASSESR